MTDAQTEMGPRYQYLTRRFGKITIIWALLFNAYFLVKLYQFRDISGPVAPVYAMALTLAFFVLAQSVRAYLCIKATEKSADSSALQATESSAKKARYGNMVLLCCWALGNNLQPVDSAYHGYRICQQIIAAGLSFFLAGCAVLWFVRHVRE